MFKHIKGVWRDFAPSNHASVMLVLSVALSGVAIGVAFSIAITAYLVDPTPRLFAVAGIGILGSLFLMGESVREYRAEVKRTAFVELRSLGVAK
jgi:hypothetical protein